MSGLDLLGMERRALFIAGGWCEAREGARFGVHDPADGSVLAEIADGRAPDAVAALDAAVDAQADWSATPPRDRGELLRRTFEALTERADDFAHLISLEMGKPVAEAAGEVGYGAEFLSWFAEEPAVRVHGRWLPAPAAGSRLLTVRKPVGPCLVFGPVAPVSTFTTEDEAVALANDTEFGLASYVYTRDLARTVRLAQALQFGMIGVNTGQVSNAAAPFGGFKASGFGREGGFEGIEEYLETTYVAVPGG